MSGFLTCSGGTEIKHWWKWFSVRSKFHFSQFLWQKPNAFQFSPLTKYFAQNSPVWHVHQLIKTIQGRTKDYGGKKLFNKALTFQIHFMSLFSFNIWNYQKTRGFLFSRGLERDQWHVKDWWCHGIVTAIIRSKLRVSIYEPDNSKITMKFTFRKSLLLQLGQSGGIPERLEAAPVGN